MRPDEIRNGDGEALKDALSDEADLNVAMIGVQLSTDGVTIGFSLAMEILVTGTARDAVHGPHPEMVGIHADGADGLLEGQLNLEAQAVEPDDFDRVQAQIGA